MLEAVSVSMGLSMQLLSVMSAVIMDHMLYQWVTKPNLVTVKGASADGILISYLALERW